MVIIFNLDEAFMPYGVGVAFKQFTFPSGCEVHMKFPPELTSLPDFDGDILLTARIRSSDDIMRMMLAADALRRYDGVRNIDCFIPYLPFARQDRVMVPGEPLSVKVMADMINMCNFRRVTVYDPHSEVSLALIRNVRVITNTAFVQGVLRNKKDYLMICPDAGAYKKIDKLCEAIGYPNEDIVICNKDRDVTNGRIKKIRVSHEDMCGKDAYIVDDICDGGMTFILLAAELRRRNVGRVYLIVSHPIISQGESVLKGPLDGVFTTNSTKDIESAFITQVPLCSHILI